MNLKFDYLDNVLSVQNNKILTFEICNKNYFYRTVNTFITLNNGNIPSGLFVSDDDLNEINLTNKVFVVLDYFNFDSLFNKYTSNIIKLVAESVTEENRIKIVNNFKKIVNYFNKTLDDIDFNINFNEEFNLTQLIKLLKPSVNTKEKLLDNLFLLIDLEKTFSSHQFMAFVNLKQYLSKNELLELYKYSIYNGIKVILIDSQSYGTTIDFEKKIIIDENLDEIML